MRRVGWALMWCGWCHWDWLLNWNVRIGPYCLGAWMVNRAPTKIKEQR